MVVADRSSTRPSAGCLRFDVVAHSGTSREADVTLWPGRAMRSLTSAASAGFSWITPAFTLARSIPSGLTGARMPTIGPVVNNRRNAWVQSVRVTVGAASKLTLRLKAEHSTL